jgi:hypothetical protein
MEGKTALHQAPGSSHSKLHKSLAAVLRPPHKRRAGANQNDERSYPPHQCQQPILSRGIYPVEKEALGEVDGTVFHGSINTLPAVRRYIQVNNIE